MGFLGYLWKQYKFSKKVKELQKRMAVMQEDLRNLPHEEFKGKYGNPSRAWALMVGEKHKLRIEQHDIS